MQHLNRAAALGLLLGTLMMGVSAYGQPAPPAASATAEAGKPIGPEPKWAPVPFTAEQIRQATSSGRTYHFLVEAAGQHPVMRTIQFTEVTDEGAKVSAKAVRVDNDEVVQPVGGGPTPWGDLVRHAHFPDSQTKRTDAEIKVPAGTFDCWLYTVTERTDGKETVNRYWFAKTLPGAPVRHEVLVDGTAQSVMRLMKHEKKGRPLK